MEGPFDSGGGAQGVVSDPVPYPGTVRAARSRNFPRRHRYVLPARRTRSPHSRNMFGKMYVLAEFM